MTHRHILTIGNSFSNNALTYVRDIARETGETFTIGRAALGGCSLKKHWNLSRYSERQPGYVTYNQGGQDDDPREGNLQTLLKARPWDLVTLQQNSAQSWQPETFQPWFDQLLALVRELAPTAEVLLHQTWAYRSDSAALKEWGIDDHEMHRRIDATYADLSRRHGGLRILPSGPALHLAGSQPGRRYVQDPAYDFAAPVAPALPRQEHSFSVGYTWVISDTPDGIPRLNLDANHLNPRGHYLTSATWFEALTGIDVRTTAFCPKTLDPEDQRFLAEMAHQTMAGRTAVAGG